MDKFEIRAIGENKYGKNKEKIQYFLRIPASIFSELKYTPEFIGFKEIGEKTYELIPEPIGIRCYKLYAEYVRTWEDFRGKKKTTKVIGNYRVTIPKMIAEKTGIWEKTTIMPLLLKLMIDFLLFS